MLKRIKVLAAAVRLNRFTVEEIAVAAQVPPKTVQSVFSRSPKNWFHRSKKRLPIRFKGGQPFQYEVTPAGRAEILEELGRIPKLGDLAPVTDTSEIPLGLRVARDALAKAQSKDLAIADSLRSSAIENLAWASSELQTRSISAETIRLRAEVAKLQEELGRESNGVSLAEPKATPTISDPVKITIYVVHDQRGAETARLASEVLQGVADRPPVIHGLNIMRCDLPRFNLELKRVHTSEGQMHVVFCVGSSKGLDEVRPVLDTVHGIGKTVLLSSGLRPAQRKYAKSRDIFIEDPYAIRKWIGIFETEFAGLAAPTLSPPPSITVGGMLDKARSLLPWR